FSGFSRSGGERRTAEPERGARGHRDVAPRGEPERSPSTAHVTTRAIAGTGSALEQLSWPEVEALLSRGSTTALLALGSTEHHGPHLPLATDTWIAAELARRLCARLPEAIELPVLALGCASEHLSFAGTLSLGETTLAAVLSDVARSLERHGFERLFV